MKKNVWDDKLAVTADKTGEEETLPAGVSRFFWSGRWWYKVGERLFATLDAAKQELQNKDLEG
jgi:hypothetical protein